MITYYKKKYECENDNYKITHQEEMKFHWQSRHMM